MNGSESKTDAYEKRFRRIALEKGYITFNQLSQAVSIQSHENAEMGMHRLMGEVCLSNDFMNANQIEDVVREIFRQ